MSRRSLLLPALVLVASACGARPASTALTPDHAAAMRDSVRTFLDTWAKDLTAPPLGTNAREATARFYAPDMVLSTDLAPDEPLLVQTLDSLVPAADVVQQPAWIRGTRFEWGTLVITPLAPGFATFTGKYVEHVSDTTGTVTALPGVQHGVVRNGPAGWRLLTVQSAHPMRMHEAQAALGARFAPTP